MSLLLDLLRAGSGKSSSRAVLLVCGFASALGLLVLCIGNVAGATINDTLAAAVAGAVAACATGGYVGGLAAKRGQTPPAQDGAP